MSSESSQPTTTHIPGPCSTPQRSALPGALLLVAALASCLVVGRPRSDGGQADGSLLSVAIWIGAVGYLVQMMFNVANLASAVPFWVLMGAIAAPYARRLHVSRRAGIAFSVVCGVLLVGSIAVSGVLLAADADYVASRLAYRGETTGDAEALASRAARLNPTSVKYARGLAQARADAVFRAGDQGAPDETVRALYSQAEQAFDGVLRVSPNDYVALAWLAGLQTWVGTRLQDPSLAEAGRATASEAAELDRTHWEIAPILSGDTSDGAVRLALSASPLP